MNTIEYLKPSQIRVDPGNVYTHADGDIQRLTHSIQEHGFLSPLVVDAASKQGLNGEASYELVGGEARLEAAKICQLAEIPCTIATFTDKKQRDLAAVALNASYGAWDDTKLATLLQDLQSQGADLDDTGLKPHELDELLASINPAAALTDPDDVPEPPETPITQRGDLITLGNHRLLCGDSTVVTDIERLMGGKQADSICTDPPYGMDYHGVTFGKEGIANDTENSWAEALVGAVALWPKVAPNALIAVCFGSARLDRFFAVMNVLAFHRLLTIYKPNRVAKPWRGWILTTEQIALFSTGKPEWPRPENHVHDLYTFDYSERPDREVDHPTVKPLSIVCDVLTKTCSPSGNVLDPFGGSGTTLIAAEQTGRRAYLMEIDPKYCDVIVRRWEDYTGKKAIRPAAKAA